MSDYRTEDLERELIEHAKQGDPEAGREILATIATKLVSGDLSGPLPAFLAERLALYLDRGVSLERALCVHSVNQGGRPRKYDPDELAAVDIILRDHAEMKPEAAAEWIREQIGADRTEIQRVRRLYDRRYNKDNSEALTEGKDLALLLDQAGSMREKVEQVLPQTD